jgi:hypothetical protein
MRVIFLDLDGVINSDRSILVCGERLEKFKGSDVPYYEKFLLSNVDPIAVEMINLLVEMTDAKIVLSSSHRKHFNKISDFVQRLEKTRQYFSKIGFDSERLIGWTPELLDVRGREIQNWLDEHSEVAHYVIIDDSADMLDEQMENFVRTDGSDGFSAQNYRDCFKILGVGLSDLLLF